MLEIFDTIDALKEWGESQGNPVELRETLWQELQKVTEYQDAEEWASAVAICEAMAIVGWGERERVDAISHFNGDCWDTYFRTATGEYRYRQGRWRKRKAGWLLFNPEYHFSQDLPDKPSQGWQEFAGVEFPSVDREKLPSQRNYLRQIPIVMGLIGGSDDTSNQVSEIKRKLNALFVKHMTPEAYGEPLEKIYFTLNCPFPGNDPDNRLKIGSYRGAQKAFYCDLYFNSSFATLPFHQQVDYFESNLEKAVNTLQDKFRKKKIDYAFDLFNQHLHATFVEVKNG